MKQKNMNTYKEVVYECPNETSIVLMKNCVNKNLDHNNRKIWIYITGIGIDAEGKKTKEIDNEYVIHRDNTENEQAINHDTLKKIIVECPDDQDDEVKENIS